MTLRSSFLLAFRFLFPHFFHRSRNGSGVTIQGETQNARRSLFGAVSCVSLSLIPLIVVLVISDSMIDGMTKRIIELSSFHIQAIQYKALSDSQKNIDELYNLVENIKMLDGVKDAYVERTGMALAAGKSARSGATIRAVQMDLFEKNKSFRELFTISDGELSFTDEKSAVIGKTLAEKAGLSVGDTIHIISMKALPNGSFVPKTSSFTVNGIVSCGYQELDALWVFVPLESGFDILASNVSRVFVGVNVENAFSNDLYKIQQEIQKISFQGFSVFNWQQLNETQYANFKTSKILLILIMFLIVLVASVNISSALIMLIMEQRKEIAILKSMGASPSGVTDAFIITGFLTGLCGVVTGIPLGFLCGLKLNDIISLIEKIVNVGVLFIYRLKSILPGSYVEYIPVHLLDPAYYLTEIKPELPLWESLAIAAGTLMLSVLVSIGPAVKAGKEKPLDTLRKI